MGKQAPPDPCRHCGLAWNCQMRGLINRLAVEAWLLGDSLQCPDHTPDFYKGIEGVFA